KYRRSSTQLATRSSRWPHYCCSGLSGAESNPLRWDSGENSCTHGRRDAAYSFIPDDGSAAAQAVASIGLSGTRVARLSRDASASTRSASLHAIAVAVALDS